MTNGPKTNSLLKRIEAQEKRQRAERLLSLQRALSKYGKRLTDFDLRDIEEAIRPAVGRIAMES